MKTTSEKLLISLAVITTLWVMLASGYLCYVNSLRPWQSLLAIAVMCIAWALRYFFHRNANGDAKLAHARRKITQSIAFGGLLLGVALIARLGWPDGMGEFGERARGVVSGVFVVFLSNSIPKQVGSASALAMRRAVGWAMVLGGLGYALAWLLLPMVYANDAAMMLMLFSVAYATIRFFWFARKQRPNSPTGSR
ncbi:MAG TPA: hypothetical protein VIF60_18325 [Burkholderiaceae bacterium]|jgi:hypothetical protein